MPRSRLLSALRSALTWPLRDWFGLRLYSIHARPLHAGSDALAAEVKGFTHRIFGPPDIDALLSCLGDPRLDLDEAFVRGAFAKGDACGGVFHRQRLVSHSWVAFTPTHDSDEFFVDFGPLRRYGYKTFTLPEFRGRHSSRFFRANNDRYCLQHGRVSAIAFIAIDNEPSLRRAVGVGYRRIGFAGHLKIGRVFIPFRTSAVRRERFRFFVPAEQ